MGRTMGRALACSRKCDRMCVSKGDVGGFPVRLTEELAFVSRPTCWDSMRAGLGP